jgi:hypothetical protein
MPGPRSADTDSAADQAIADALDKRIEDSRKTADDGPDDDEDGAAGSLAEAG